MRVVNRVLRDTGIFLGGGIIAERIIEQYPHYLNPGVAGYSVVSYGWPYEAVKIITTSANPPGYSFQTFTDNFLRNSDIRCFLSFLLVLDSSDSHNSANEKSSIIIRRFALV